MKRRELFWMLVPCLVFAGAALWLRPREAAREAADETQRQADEARLREPFRLVAEKIERRPVSAKDAADGYDTKVVVTLGHKGVAPPWWDKGVSAISDYWTGWGNSGLLFYESGGKGAGKSRPVASPFDSRYRLGALYMRAARNSKTNKYEAFFLVTLRTLPPTREKIVLRTPVAIEDYSGSSNSRWKQLTSPVPVVCTVRGPRETIKAPAVSRDAQVDVTDVEIMKPSPAEQKTNGGFDTELQIHLLDKKSASQGSGGAWDGDMWGSDKFLNGQEKEILPYVYGESRIQEDAPNRRTLIYQLRLNAVARRVRDITSKSTFTRSDRWPLELRIPLRRNGKDVEGTLNRSQFRVAPVKGK